MSRVEPLVLRVGEEKVLREWTRASSGSAGLAQRARILLLAAQGHSNTEIGRLVGVSLPTVRLWRSRYGAGGVGGLGDLARSGRPARARGDVDHRRDARSAAGVPRGDALVVRQSVVPIITLVSRVGSDFLVGV